MIQGCTRTSTVVLLRTFSTKLSYPRIVEVSTRFADNDIQGHINNVQYYAFMDTAINKIYDNENDKSFARHKAPYSSQV